MGLDKMIYCPDCELTFDENDIEDTQVEDGTVYCHCGCELKSFDLDVGWRGYEIT